MRDEQGRVLVCKEGVETLWSLPGGGWDHGESEEECLKRELYEELGYEGSITYKPLTTKIFHVPQLDAQILWIIYDVRLDHIVETIGEHTTAVAYIDPDEFKASRMGTSLQAQAAIYQIARSQGNS